MVSLKEFVLSDQIIFLAICHHNENETDEQFRKLCQALLLGFDLALRSMAKMKNNGGNPDD